MVEKVFLQTVLFGIAVSEWVEITRVGTSRNKQNADSMVTYTHPSYYEITLGRPHFYDTTTQSPTSKQSTKPIKNGKILHPIQDYSDENNNGTSDENNYEETLERSDITVEDDSTEYSYEDDELDEEEPTENKQSSSNVMMSVLRHVQDQLLDFKGRSFDAKVDHLKKLRDTILYEIKHKISRLFKSDESSSSRTLYKDDEHHMDYPSHEGALMTIGFLTFAVFLIKLVLKLIYTLKLKQQYYQTTTTTTPVSIFLRNERDLSHQETAKILQSIEEYPLS